jgi:two-component system chemotaxis sensor kinase CheA
MNRKAGSDRTAAKKTASRKTVTKKTTSGNRYVDQDALVKAFVVESDEHLRLMEEALIALEGRPDDKELLATIFRAAHTLKGSAGACGFPEISGFAHAVEDLLDRLRDGKLKVNREVVGLLLQCVDALGEAVAAVNDGKTTLSDNHRALLEHLRELLEHGADGGGPPHRSPAEDILPQPSSGARLGAGRTGTLRIDIDKLDQLLNLTTEIFIARGSLSQILEQHAENGSRAAMESHNQADRLYEDLQETVTAMRMVPLGPTLRQQQRTVRDVAGGQKKLVELIVEGEDVEVDMAVNDALRDPLTHLVRNAVDHGIEDATARMKSGKEPTAQLTIRAYHDGGSVVVRVEDDGRGISRERVIERARRTGIAAEPESLSTQELLSLLFQPGFSTAETITELSGRGVGLDVVKRDIEALRGIVSVESREGTGTTFTIRVPLTLAIISGLEVFVAGETFIIPMEHVIECAPQQGKAADTSGRNGVINLRGEAVPYLGVRQVLELEGPRLDREHVVLVRSGRSRAGLVVDWVKGERQAVIKPLSPLLRGQRGLSGLTILGDGRVAMILDVVTLVREAVESGGGFRSGTLEGAETRPAEVL